MGERNERKEKENDEQWWVMEDFGGIVRIGNAVFKGKFIADFKID